MMMKNIIVNRIIKTLNNHNAFDSEIQQQKVRYILLVLVGEIEKTITLFGVFWLFDKGIEYVISLFTVAFTRTFAGGPHENSGIKCFIHTILFFAGAIVLAEFAIVKSGILLVMTVCIFVFWMYAPIISEKRGSYSKKRREKLKLLSIAGVLLVCVYAIIFNNKGIVCATLMLELSEFLLLLLKKNGGKENVGDD